jgi:hypothetical protein
MVFPTYMSAEVGACSNRNKPSSAERKSSDMALWSKAPVSDGMVLLIIQTTNVSNEC